MDRGVNRGSVVMTDLPNVAEGLLLQLACSRLGAAVATAKGPDKLHVEFQCRVVANRESWLANEVYNVPMIVAGETLMEEMLHVGGDIDNPLDDDSDEYAPERPLGFFGSAKALTQGSAVHQGQDMKTHLAMTENDRSCVSITLYHAFGIGSGCSSSLLSCGTIVLPAVGGLHGCGVPSQRASATLKTLESEKCTLLFADTHTLKALNDESLAPELEKAQLSLRGGICKTGSGATILDATVRLANATLSTLGTN